MILQNLLIKGVTEIRYAEELVVPYPFVGVAFQTLTISFLLFDLLLGGGFGTLI